jgi:ketosteroid isomerase-like protein
MRMSKQNLAHERLVRTAYEAFAKGDLDTLRTLNSEDSVWHTPGISPFNTEYKSVDGVMAYFTQLFELTEGTIKVEPEHMYGDDERVVVLEHVTASRHGKHIDFHDVLVFEIRDGKLHEITQYELDVKALETFWA